MGEVTAVRVALVFGGLFSLILLAWLFVLGYLRSTDTASPGLKLYRKLCHKLEKKGLKRPVDVTPGQFGQMAVDQFPDQGASIREATQLYEEINYGEPPVEQETRLLQRLKAAISRI